MQSNPDINRLSLEERIQRLETRLPTPGLGGNSDLFVSPDVIEQCKVNAFTDIGIGLVARVEIDDLATLTTSPGGQNHWRNFGVKWAGFMPRVQGIIMNANMFYIRFTCLRTATFPNTERYPSSVVMMPSFDFSVYESEVANKTAGRVINGSVLGFANIRYCFLANNQQSFYFGPCNGIGLVMRLDTRQVNFVIRSNGGNTIPIIPCTSFQVINTSFFPYTPQSGVPLIGGANATVYQGHGTLGDYNTNTGWTGIRATDLPDRFRQFYPRSWYS